MGYSYGYDGFYDGIMIFATILPIILFFSLGLAFVFYIFDAIGVYQLSKRRGYRNAWLAFIPIANSYALGGLADNINFCYGKKSSFRIWLLVLRIINSFTGVIMIAPMFTFIAEAINYSYFDETYLAQFFTSTMLTSSFIGLISIGLTIVTYICQYKVYSDYSPKNATMFLVLSILFGIAPFFLFAIRNNNSASLYYSAQRNGQPPYQPPFNGQGGQPPYQPPFNAQGGQPPYQPPFNAQGGQPPYQPPFNAQGGQPPYQPPFNTQGVQQAPSYNPPPYNPQGVTSTYQPQQPVQFQPAQPVQLAQPVQPTQPVQPSPYQKPTVESEQESTQIDSNDVN